MKVVQLPVPSTAGSMTVEAALSKIQGVAPAVSDQPLKLSEISQLAWAAQGRPTSPTDSAASVDERSLMKVYFALPDGFYLYIPSSHSLQQTRDVDLRASAASQLLRQQNAPVGGCQIVLGGSVKDFNARYGTRARNVMLLLAGQMIQSMQLEAAALNLTFVGINNMDLMAVRKAFTLGKDVEPLYVLIVGYAGTATAGAGAGTPPAGSFKKVVIIAPQNGFQDVEFFETRRLLEMNSVQVTVASMRAGPIRSMGGTAVQADLGISDVHPADYSALIFVGGPGTSAMFNTQPLRDLVREAAAQRKIMAASGNAPGILAAAGVLKGSRVTGALEIQNMLVTAGAAYTGRTVEKDGPLITSMDPQFTPLFVQAILDGLAGM
jgi:SagB-type dehydrogenase family enzyme